MTDTTQDRLRDGADRFLKWAHKEQYSGPSVLSIPRHPANIDVLLETAATHIDAQDAKIKALVEALETSVATIEDYIAYEHDGDPWSEDARAMREMDIDYYATDGRLDKAKGLIAAEKEAT